MEGEKRNDEKSWGISDSSTSGKPDTIDALWETCWSRRKVTVYQKTP